MTSFRLTPQQLTAFNTFGFLAFPGLLKDRVDDIIANFEQVFVSHGGGHAGLKHDGKKRSCIVQFADLNPVLSSLIDDPRIKGIAESLVGEDFNYMGSDGNYYAGDTSWHSDGWHPQVKHIKLAYYLDPLTRDTGCLRVIPGSHRIGEGFSELANEQIYACDKSWGMAGRDVPAVALETKPGDVLVFNHNLKHASFGGNGWRRMFTMNCCQRYPEPLVPELREYLSSYSRFWVERAYGDTMIRTATPERQRHLEQVMANDGHLAELSRKARAEMAEPSRG